MAEAGFSNYPSQYVLRENCWLIGQEVGNNRSLIGFQLFIDKRSGTGRWGNEAANWQFYLNGGAVWNESTGSYSYDFRNYSTLTLIGNGQAWVGHDAAGNCYLSIQGNASFGQLGTAQVNSGFWLPAIPRASTPSWSGNFEAGTAKTINMNRASSGFTHTVQYAFGNIGFTNIATGVSDSVSWTPPLSLLQQIPNSVSGTGTIRVITYNGSSNIGTRDVTFTLVAPATAVPTINAPVITEDDSTIAALMGAGVYIQKLSKVNVVVTGSGYQGSTIAQGQFTINGVTASSGNAITPQSSGTVDVSSKVTDTRGRVATRSDKITVRAYSTPTINSFSVQRANASGVVQNEGTYLRVALNSVVSTLKNAANAEKNTLGIRMFTRLKGATAWTARNVINHTALSYNSNFLISGAPYAVNQSYDVRIEVFDKFAVAAGQTFIATAKIYMNWATSGMGVGKYWEKGALDVNGDVYSSGVLLSTPLGSVTQFAGATAPTGWLLCQGQAISRTTYADLYALIGDTYGAGNGTSTFNLPNLKGRIPVGLDSGQTEFNVLGETGGAKTHTLGYTEVPVQKGLRMTWGQGNIAFNPAPNAYQGAPPGNSLGTFHNDARYDADADSSQGGQPHNNLQPYITLNYIIKVI